MTQKPSSRRKDHEIPLAPLDRILHQAGAERVREEAAMVLRDFLEKLAREIARESVEASRHAERKTVTEEDVKFAISRVQRVLCANLEIAALTREK
ncbi:MAG: NFYB/HAP3 family transcription factor subunit [Thermofilum sp.]